MNKHSHQLHVLARPFRALLARHHGGAHPTLAAGDSQHPHADSDHGHGGTGAAATSAARWLLPVLLVAQLMVILDITAVNIALPSLSRDLDISGASISWTITSYTLIFGSLLLFGGRAADLLGRRRVFLTGLAVFTASSLASALAGTATTLFMARAGQGLGAALLSPAALSIIAAAFHGPQRTKALAAWAAVGGAGAAVGVLVGGLLTVLDGGTVKAGSSWAPSPRLALLLGNVTSLVGTRAVAFRFTPVGSGAAFQIDDVYLDPWKCT